MTESNRIVAELLGVICTFEHKIESLKQSLCGYSNFDPRQLFSLYEKDQSGHITSQSFMNNLSNKFSHLKQHIPLIISKHGKAGKISYQQFIEFVSPKNKKSLLQSLFLRNNQFIQPYLIHKFEQLSFMNLILLIEVQRMKNILIYDLDMNVDDMFEKVGAHLQGQNEIYSFLRSNHIEIEKQKIKYLRNYLNIRKQLQQSQIRLLFSPLSAIKQHKTNSYINNNNYRQPSRLNSTFNQLPTRTKSNFLNVKYQPKNNRTLTGFNSTYKDSFKQNNSISNLPLDVQISHSIVKQIPINLPPQIPSNPPKQQQQVGIPLLQFFGKNSRFEQKNKSFQNKNESIYQVLDRFTSHQSQFKNKKSPSPKTKVKFQDDSSFLSQSAFKYY